jgi:hypothetical protein
MVVSFDPDTNDGGVASVPRNATPYPRKKQRTEEIRNDFAEGFEQGESPHMTREHSDSPPQVGASVVLDSTVDEGTRSSGLNRILDPCERHLQSSLCTLSSIRRLLDSCYVPRSDNPLHVCSPLSLQSDEGILNDPSLADEASQPPFFHANEMHGKECATNEEKDDVQDESSRQHGDAVMDEQDAADAEQEEWEDVAREIVQAGDDAPSSYSFQHLDSFQKGVERNQAAMQRLELVFEQVDKGLEDNLTNQLLGCVAQMHSHIFAEMEAAEKDIQQHFVSNQECRTRMLQCLDHCNATWQSNSERLFRSIQGETTNTTEDSPDSSKMPPPMRKDGEGRLTKERCDSDQGAGDEMTEPNWDELMEHEPSSRSIEAFLQGRERWQAAQERFSAALDQIHAGLKELQGNVLQVVVEAIEIMNEKNEEQQIDIRSKLGSNFKRRQFLESAIAKAAQHQHGMFANLYARVGNSMMSAMMGIRLGGRKT